MDSHSARAETLPELYRAVLDAATALERRGHRGQAARTRTRAAKAYAVWDEKAEKRLERLLEETRLLARRPPRRPTLAMRLGHFGRRATTTG